VWSPVEFRKVTVLVCDQKIHFNVKNERVMFNIECVVHNIHVGMGRAAKRIRDIISWVDDVLVIFTDVDSCSLIRERNTEKASIWFKDRQELHSGLVSCSYGNQLARLGMRLYGCGEIVVIGEAGQFS